MTTQPVIQVILFLNNKIPGFLKFKFTECILKLQIDTFVKHIHDIYLQNIELVLHYFCQSEENAIA